MPENNDDLPPRAQPQGQQPSGPPGETVDLSNPDAEEEPQYSDVPVRPEVQEEIDKYYAEKEQENDDDQQDVDERTPDEFNIDQRDEAEGGTDIQNEDDEPFAEAKTVSRPGDDPETQESGEPEEIPPEETANAGSYTSPEPEPDPRQEAQEATAEDPVADSDATDAPEDTPSELSLEGQDIGEDVDLDEIDLDSIENQTWGLGKRKPAKMVAMKGMKFLLTEPEDDDTVVNSISKVRRGDLMTAFKALVQITVEAPKITDERWEQDMTAMERFSLGNIVL